MEVTVGADRNVSPKDTEEEAMEFDVQCAVEEEDNGMDTSPNSHWNPEVVESYKVFLLSSGTKYPDHYDKKYEKKFQKERK